MLKVEQLSRSFGKVKALDQVSLQIPEGCFFALLGPSGCGKTTLLRTHAGLESPDSGRILWHDEDLTHVAAQQRPFNTVFQSYALFPHMSVLTNVEFGLRVKGVVRDVRRRRALDMLKLVQMQDFADSNVTKLSGGQQQRVALARALVNEPKVLLLDEPLSALDLKLRRSMQRELLALHRRVGLTFVLVTHDQEEAMSMASDVAILSSGRVLQTGTPRDLYDAPADNFVAQFFGEINKWVGTVRSGRHCGLSSDFAFEGDGGDFKCPFINREGLGVGQKVACLVRPHRITIAPVAKASSTHECRVTGRVVATTFKGDRWDVEVELTSRQSWTVSLVVAPQREIPEPSQQVELSWPVEATVVLPI